MSRDIKIYLLFIFSFSLTVPFIVTFAEDLDSLDIPFEDVPVDIPAPESDLKMLLEETAPTGTRTSDCNCKCFKRGDNPKRSRIFTGKKRKDFCLCECAV